MIVDVDVRDVVTTLERKIEYPEFAFTKKGHLHMPKYSLILIMEYLRPREQNVESEEGIDNSTTLWYTRLCRLN